MTEYRLALFHALFCSLLAACGGGAPASEEGAPASSAGAETASQTPEEAPPETAPAPAPEAAAEAAAAQSAKAAEPEPDPPRYAALITVVAKDYEAWKAAFDGQLAMRKEATVTGHTVLRHPKRPAKVAVLLLARHQDPLEAFLDSEERKKAMADAGERAPKVEVLSWVEDKTDQQFGNMHTAVLSFEVGDFDDWKKAFDAGAEGREEADLYGYAIATADSDKVVLFLQASEEEARDKFLKSKSLKDIQKAGGVKGEVDIRKFVEDEDATYK
ncbi:MAG: hypothetical protein OEZ06_17050 [Myxococcales bacterium]|nr:hypothetical protein [Myxococcales bacterium]